MHMREPRPSRRRFLGLVGGVVAVVGGPKLAWADLLPRTGFRAGHPAPRPGITAAKVVKAKDISNPDIRALFDLVREIPQVVDGIRCSCGCATIEGFYSLLSCYEDGGMAQSCQVCQEEGRMVHQLHKKGLSLNGIRAAIDAKYDS